MCILYLEHVSVWISHTSVTMCGCHIGHVVTRLNRDHLKNWRGNLLSSEITPLGEQILVARAGRWARWFLASWLSRRAVISEGKYSNNTGLLGLGMGWGWESSCFLVRMSQVPWHTSLEEGWTSRPYSDGAPRRLGSRLWDWVEWNLQVKDVQCLGGAGNSVKMKARGSKLKYPHSQWGTLNNLQE